MVSKYKDPASLNCPSCTARSSYRVAVLLKLEARCASCDEPLVQIGIEMRNSLDEWAAFVAKLVMTQRLSEHLGVHFADDDVDEIKTLRELSKRIEGHLKDAAQASARAVDLTRWAVTELEEHPLWRPRSATHRLDFDAALLDVLDPGRWDYSDASPWHLAVRHIQS